MSRSLIGAVAGVVFVVLWVTFGASTAWIAAGVGAVGFLIGSVLDRPGAVIEFLQRLER